MPHVRDLQRKCHVCVGRHNKKRVAVQMALHGHGQHHVSHYLLCDHMIGLPLTCSDFATSATHSRPRPCIPSDDLIHRRAKLLDLVPLTCQTLVMNRAEFAAAIDSAIVKATRNQTDDMKFVTTLRDYIMGLIQVQPLERSKLKAMLREFIPEGLSAFVDWCGCRLRMIAWIRNM